MRTKAGSKRILSPSWESFEGAPGRSREATQGGPFASERDRNHHLGTGHRYWKCEKHRPNRPTFLGRQHAAAIRTIGATRGAGHPTILYSRIRNHEIYITRRCAPDEFVSNRLHGELASSQVVRTAVRSSTSFVQVHSANLVAPRSAWRGEGKGNLCGFVQLRTVRRRNRNDVCRAAAVAREA